MMPLHFTCTELAINRGHSLFALLLLQLLLLLVSLQCQWGEKPLTINWLGAALGTQLFSRLTLVFKQR
jgi:hypothetical protein